MQEKQFEEVIPNSRAAWRSWLQMNHTQKKSIWLVIAKKDSLLKSLSVQEANEEALCFGWIDSLINKRDEQTFKLLMSPRKPKGNWSRVNKQRIAKLSKAGLITPAGQAMIDLAKTSGTWTALDQVENLVVPADLAAAFEKIKGALAFWESQPRSAKRGTLEWIFNAKKPETRQRRIAQTAEKIGQGKRVF